MPRRIHFLFAADSRAYSFDQYKKPADISCHVHFIIKRGAVVEDLISPTLAKIRRWGIDDVIIIRLAAGINNLTELYSLFPNTKKVLRRSTVTADDLLHQFAQFKRAVHRVRPNALVGLTTIAPASFARFQTYKQLAVPILDDEALQTNQQELDSIIDTVNATIKTINTTPQHGFTLRTLSWHTAVRKTTKRRGRYHINYAVRNNFAPLYDGLHAKSTLKRKWYKLVYQVFEREYKEWQHKIDN